MNKYLSSPFYKGRRAPLGACLVAFDAQGQCTGVVKREGQPVNPPEPIGEPEITAARQHPNFFTVDEACPVPLPVPLSAAPDQTPVDLDQTVAIEQKPVADAPPNAAPDENGIEVVEVEGKATVEVEGKAAVEVAVEAKPAPKRAAADSANSGA